MSLYSSDNQINLTVVSGSSYTGLQAVDGSYNIVINDGSAYTGLYHRCGAFNAVVVTDRSSFYNKNGSINVIANNFGGYTLIDPIGLAGNTPARQPTYYFASNGNDSNDGLTSSTPKQTLSAFNSLSLSPTDWVVFRGGDTFTGTLTINGGGSSSSNLIIGSYGTGRATIAPSANTNGVVITNRSYFTIKDLIITGTGTTAGDGLSIINTSGAATNITVDNCSASGFAHCGIWSNVTGGSITNLTITNCVTNGNSTGVLDNGCGLQLRGVYGAQMSGSYSFINPYIFNCIANNNTGAAGTSNWCGSGIHTAQCSGGGIFSCYADNNGQNVNATSGPSGIWISDCRDHYMQSCESSNNKTSLADGVGFDMDGGCTRCVTQYCYSHGNYGAGLMCFTYSDAANILGNIDNVIRYNVSSNDCTGGSTGEGGIYAVSAINSPNTGLLIYGNTVFTQGTSANSACAVLSNASGSTLSGTIANNIFLSRSSSKMAIATGGPNFNVTGNCWYPTAGQAFSITWGGSTYSSYAAWQTATNLEKINSVNVGLNTDPLLVNAGYSGMLSASSNSQKNSFKLSSSSPCLGAGVNLLSQYNINVGGRDYYNSTAPRSGSVYDIGCSAGAASLSSVSATYTDHAEDTSSQTTYTWSSKNFAIGSTSSDRLIVAIIRGRIGANTTATCNSVTIGGVAATKINDGRNTAGGALTTESIWMALVPTGTTATVSATFSNAMLRSAISIYSVTGSNGDVPSSINTAAYSDSTTATTGTFIMTVPAGGVGIIGSSISSVASGTPTLTPTNYILDQSATALGITFVGSGKTVVSAAPTLYTSAWTGNTPQSASAVGASFMPIVN